VNPGKQLAPSGVPKCACSGNEPAKVLLENLERSTIVIAGPVTGRAYAFAGPNTVKAVHAADAEGLERTGFFRRVE